MLYMTDGSRWRVPSDVVDEVVASYGSGPFQSNTKRFITIQAGRTPMLRLAIEHIVAIVHESVHVAGERYMKAKPGSTPAP